MDRGTIKRLPVIKANSHVASDTPVAALLIAQLTTKRMRQVTWVNTCGKTIMNAIAASWLNELRILFFSAFFPPKTSKLMPRISWCLIVGVTDARLVRVKIYFGEDCYSGYYWRDYRNAQMSPAPFPCLLPCSLVAPAMERLGKEGFSVQSKTISIYLQAVQIGVLMLLAFPVLQHHSNPVCCDRWTFA